MTRKKGEVTELEENIMAVLSDGDRVASSVLIHGSVETWLLGNGVYSSYSLIH